jgi:hypothetical protein
MERVELDFPTSSTATGVSCLLEEKMTPVLGMEKLGVQE